MLILRSVAEVRAYRRATRQANEALVLVPTMGALHAGHLSLMRQARRPNGRVMTSIFVNPTQFGPEEDLDRYPRDEAGDLAQCRSIGCDAVFLPTVAAMYPPGASTRVTAPDMARYLCGTTRPGHFDGVCTIVTKLFNLTGCDAAVFGEKDYQQLAIIRQMARDLDLPVEVLSGPIARDPDGVAMSSRNRNLSLKQRRAARILSEALVDARADWMVGVRAPAALCQTVLRRLSSCPEARIDYIEIADPVGLQPQVIPAEATLIALAVFFGETRLIDNVVLGR